MTRTTMTKTAFIAYSALTIALMMVSAELMAAPRRPLGTMTAQPMVAGTAPTMGAGMAGRLTGGMATAADGAPGGAMTPSTDYVDPPSPDEVLAPEEHSYRPVRLEVRKIIWFDPGQRGLIEAHPLVMGLAAMALATVTLLFFFLHGIKRPKDGEL